jgi:hypothetical protein
MSEVQALKKPFLLGVLAVGIGVAIIVGVVALFVVSTDDRPEGIAERWLSSVGDLTRDGIHSDAVARVRGHGDVALGEGLVANVKADGKAAFTSLEVGKARRTGDTALVPAQLVARGDDTTRRYVVVLQRDGDSWRVTALRPPDPTLKVPSEGGDVAAKAPVSLYLIALVIGVGIAAGAAALVRAAGREHDAALSAA